MFDMTYELRQKRLSNLAVDDLFSFLSNHVGQRFMISDQRGQPSLDRVKKVTRTWVCGEQIAIVL